MSQLKKFDNAGKVYRNLAIGICMLEILMFIYLYLKLPSVIPYRNDLTEGADSGSKTHLLYIQLIFAAIIGFLFWNQRTGSTMKLNWPTNEAFGLNVHIVARWMLRKILFFISLLLSTLIIGGLFNTLMIIPSAIIHYLIIAQVVVLIVITFHSIMKLQDANEGRLS